MTETESPMKTLVRCIQEENAFGSITSTPSAIRTSSKKGQFTKARAAIVRTGTPLISPGISIRGSREFFYPIMVSSLPFFFTLNGVFRDCHASWIVSARALRNAANWSVFFFFIACKPLSADFWEWLQFSIISISWTFGAVNKNVLNFLCF